MRTWLYVLLLASLGWIGPTSARVRGQQPPAAESGAPTDSPVTEVKPEMFYLRNKNGDLVYVPNFSFEEWERLVRIARNLANPQRPAVVIQEMTIRGEIQARQVTLHVEYTIQRRGVAEQEPAGWVRVPLRLNQAILDAQPQFEGTGDHFVTFDDARDGYVVWIQSKPETTHKVSMQMVVPLSHAGDESHFSLTAPTPLASRISLRVSDREAEGTVESALDNISRPLTFATLAEGGGEFSARGIRGKVTFRWHKFRSVGSPDTARLDVFGSIVVTADELLQEVRSDGHFVIRGFGSPIETFRVRLPPGMRFRESPEPGYKVQVVPNEQDPSMQIVEVRLDRAAAHEAHIRLIAELPPGHDDVAGMLSVAKLVDRPTDFEPARFEFVGAARHRGQIDFVVKGDWALRWNENANIPRVEWGVDPTSHNSAVARFRYYAQPCDLRASLRQKATRVSVEPGYDLFVDARQVRLFGELTCKTSGAKAGPLALRLKNWSVETVQFDDVENSTPIDLTQVDPLVIPIPVEAQSMGRFVLRVEARRDLTAGVISGTQALRIVLPQVEAANPARANLIVSPATITITPAQNVALTPRLAEMQAMGPLVNPASPSADGNQWTVFRYRDRGAMEPASFVGDFRVQPRSISVSVSSAATLARDSLDLEQRFSYTVLHEPVTTLWLSVPNQLVEEDRVKVRLVLDDQPLAPLVVGPLDEHRTRIQVLLAKPLLGPAELRVIPSPIPIPELAADQTEQLTIPLVLPVTDSSSATTIVENNVTLAYHKSFDIELMAGPWTVNQSDSAPRKMLLTTASDGGDVLLRLALRRASLAGSTIVRQTWIQSWIAGERRRDRAVFRVLTNESQLSVMLPRDAKREAALIKVALDQQEVQPATNSSRGEVILNLNDANGQEMHEHVVEVWYELPEGRTTRGVISLDAATLDAADRAERSFWQVILPADELLILGDRAMTAERTWQWSRFGWRRQPLREQIDLEDWIGASRQYPVPAAVPRYLFTTFGTPRHMEIITAARSQVVLLASGMVLTAGLLLVYFPTLRHPTVLLVGGVGVLAIGTVYPELAIMISQAAGLGAVLVIVAHGMYRVMGNGDRGSQDVARQPMTDSRMMELRFGRGESSAKVATTATPISLHPSSAESKS